MHRSFKESFRRLLSSVGTAISGKRAAAAGRMPKGGIAPYVNRIVSDAMLFNEIPSPTDREAGRADFILRRLQEFGYHEASVDEFGNVTAVVPAREATDAHVLLFSDMRNDDFSPLESTTRLADGRVWGRGIAESSAGVAALLVLAEYLAATGLQYAHAVVFLFTSFDPAGGDIQPLERFLQEWRRRLRLAVHVRGVELGRIDERPLGVYRLTATLSTPQPAAPATGPGVSAISVLSNIAHRLGSVRWDIQNDTFLNIARLDAGVGFGWYAGEGSLELEVFSLTKDSLEMAKSAVCATIQGICGETGASVDIAVKSYIPPAKPGINSELSAILRSVYERLKIKAVPVSLPDYAAISNSLDIPSISLGVATGRKGITEEYIDVHSVETGFRQLIAFLERCAGSAHEEAGR